MFDYSKLMIIFKKNSYNWNTKIDNIEGLSTLRWSFDQPFSKRLAGKILKMKSLESS